jgi:hypothetical protein
VNPSGLAELSDARAQTIDEATARLAPAEAPRANKPKALSAQFTAELGMKAGSESRAVLLADKTPPCPNEVRFLLTHDEQFWSVLRESEAKRLLLPRSDAIHSSVSQTALLRRKKMQREPKKSRTIYFASIASTELVR